VAQDLARSLESSPPAAEAVGSVVNCRHPKVPASDPRYRSNELTRSRTANREGVAMRGRCKRSRARLPSRGTARGGGRPAGEAVACLAEFPTCTACTVTWRPFHPKAVWTPRSRRRYTSSSAFRGDGATRGSLRTRTWRSPPGGGSRHQRASPSDARVHHPKATAAREGGLPLER
jgi:hypothetical protein